MVMMWAEFRQHVLPWLLAAAVIGLMAHQENKRTARLNELLLRQAQSLESVHILLSTQGYLVPPTQEPRSVFEGFGSP
jgi:N-acetyl-anhydromuramyl-L-alanine amidase AmpD